MSDYKCTEWTLGNCNGYDYSESSYESRFIDDNELDDDSFYFDDQDNMTFQ